MARRRKTKTANEFAKPLLGLALLALLWGAYQIGLVDVIAELMLAPLQPD